MAFLTLVMDPTIAISLLTLPIIFTNIMQYAGCANPRPIARKYWIFALAIVLSIFITSFFILSYPKALLTICIGLAMIAFSLTQMFGTKFLIGDGHGWHIGVGLFSGVLGGLSSIWSPPVAMYFWHAMSKNRIIGATGFYFCRHYWHWDGAAGVLTADTVLHSLMGLVVAIDFVSVVSASICAATHVSADCPVGVFDYGTRLIVIGRSNAVAHMPWCGHLHCSRHHQ